MKLSKKMKTALDFLGSKYSVQSIDMELCIYRDLQNGYDIEVSGIARPERGCVANFVCVWDIILIPKETFRSTELRQSDRMAVPALSTCF